MNEVYIEAVDSFTYLGIKIDRGLRMKLHLNSCVKRAYGKLFMLGKIRRYMDKKTSLNLFKCMVLPYIEYGNSFLLGSDKASLVKLQRIQNKGLTIVLGRDIRHITDILHKEAGLASWEVRAHICLMRLMFKYKFCAEYLIGTYTGSATRAQDGPLFMLDKLSNDRYRRSSSYISRKEWNSLPAYIHCINDHKKFKYEIRLFYYHR